MSPTPVSSDFIPPQTYESETLNTGDVILTFATEEFITPKFVNGEEEEDEASQ
jgi:hypothetical protein